MDPQPPRKRARAPFEEPPKQKQKQSSLSLRKQINALHRGDFPFPSPVSRPSSSSGPPRKRLALDDPDALQSTNQSQTPSTPTVGSMERPIDLDITPTSKDFASLMRRAMALKEGSLSPIRPTADEIEDLTAEDDLQTDYLAGLDDHLRHPGHHSETSQTLIHLSRPSSPIFSMDFDGHNVFDHQKSLSNTIIPPKIFGDDERVAWSAPVAPEFPAGPQPLASRLSFAAANSLWNLDGERERHLLQNSRMTARDFAQYSWNSRNRRFSDGASTKANGSSPEGLRIGGGKDTLAPSATLEPAFASLAKQLQSPVGSVKMSAELKLSFEFPLFCNNGAKQVDGYLLGFQGSLFPGQPLHALAPVKKPEETKPDELVDLFREMYEQMGMEVPRGFIDSSPPPPETAEPALQGFVPQEAQDEGRQVTEVDDGEDAVLKIITSPISNVSPQLPQCDPIPIPVTISQASQQEQVGRARQSAVPLEQTFQAGENYVIAEHAPTGILIQQETANQTAPLDEMPSLMDSNLTMIDPADVGISTLSAPPSWMDSNLTMIDLAESQHRPQIGNVLPERPADRISDSMDSNITIIDPVSEEQEHRLSNIFAERPAERVSDSMDSNHTMNDPMPDHQEQRPRNPLVQRLVERGSNVMRTSPRQGQQPRDILIQRLVDRVSDSMDSNVTVISPARQGSRTEGAGNGSTSNDSLLRHLAALNMDSMHSNISMADAEILDRSQILVDAAAAAAARRSPPSGMSSNFSMADQPPLEEETESRLTGMSMDYSMHERDSTYIDEGSDESDFNEDDLTIEPSIPTIQPKGRKKASKGEYDPTKQARLLVSKTDSTFSATGLTDSGPAGSPSGSPFGNILPESFLPEYVTPKRRYTVIPTGKLHEGALKPTRKPRLSLPQRLLAERDGNLIQGNNEASASNTHQHPPNTLARIVAPTLLGASEEFVQQNQPFNFQPHTAAPTNLEASDTNTQHTEVAQNVKIAKPMAQKVKVSAAATLSNVTTRRQSALARNPSAAASMIPRPAQIHKNPPSKRVAAPKSQRLQTLTENAQTEQRGPARPGSPMGGISAPPRRASDFFTGANAAIERPNPPKRYSIGQALPVPHEYRGSATTSAQTTRLTESYRPITPTRFYGQPQPVPARPSSALGGRSIGSGRSQSGRLSLGTAYIDRDHPLIVNDEQDEDLDEVDLV